MFAQNTAYATLLLLLAVASHVAESAPVDNRLLQSASLDSFGGITTDAWVPKSSNHKTDKKPDLSTANKDTTIPLLATPVPNAPVAAVAPVAATPKPAIPATPVPTTPPTITILPTIPDLANLDPSVATSEDATVIADAMAGEGLDVDEDSMDNSDSMDEERSDMLKEQRVFFNQDPFYNPNAQFIMATAREREAREAERAAMAPHEESESFLGNMMPSGISGVGGNFLNFLKGESASHDRYHIKEADTVQEMAPSNANTATEMPMRRIDISMPSTMDWVEDGMEEQ
ncbi:hypothetical protein BDF22DRAFT_694202 [Syncephalis plumigaleata]|nr:hypothetical protein BDF22DRAFT_694202 [Syncephalis plumigaleata]